MANSNMVMARSVGLAVLACALAGCMVGPSFVRPKPSVPAQWSPTAHGQRHHRRRARDF